MLEFIGYDTPTTETQHSPGAHLSGLAAIAGSARSSLEGFRDPTPQTPNPKP